MTTTIAAVSVGRDGNAVFVLCADGKLSQGALGSHNRATKLFHLGYNWMALMAGYWNTARGLCEALMVSMAASGRPPSDKGELKDVIETAGNRFAASSLWKEDEPCRLIITGFIEGSPVMLKVDLEEKHYITIDPEYDFCAAGSGEEAAKLLLNHRGADPLKTSLEEACYAIYEAKKFSEMAEGVGPVTHIYIHANRGDGKLCYNELSEKALEHLEEVRKRSSLQPVTDLMPKFPSSFFI
ncbi:MAG: hypothetical protein ABI972_24185 [Acidobacteriota bacterium]